MDGYCVKCKKMREMKSGKKVKMVNGLDMMKGSCSKCGTGMCKII